MRQANGGSVMKHVALVFSFTLLLAGYAEAQTPRKGGTIRMTAPYGAGLSGLDMHNTPRANDDIYGKVVHRTLYNYDSDKGVPVLELAKSVAVSNNGLTHTFKLRDDAFFHNGKKMTADDVIYSFTRIMDGKRAFPAARWVRIIKGAVDVEKGQATTIAGLKKIDDFTLEMTLTDRVDPGFYFYNGSTAIYPVGEADKPEFLQKPIGLGPFKFVEHVPGSRLVAERWEKFYKPGMPYADRVVISMMGEAPARDVAFRNKEIDLSILGPAQYVAYREDPNLKSGILEVAEVFTRHMGMNLEFKPFSDKRVRQAINHAIDTDLIIKRLVKDKAYRATSWLPQPSPAYDKARKPYAYDPEKAKKLLAEAGYKDGFEFEWTTSQNESWGLPIVEAVIPMLARVGIKVKVKQVEVNVLIDLRSKGEFQAFILSAQSGPDALGALKCFHSATPMTACNYYRFKNAEFDKLVDAAGQTDNADERNALLRKADAILHEEAPVWFFNYNKAVMAYQPWIKGLQANATELTHQYPEYVWVEESSPAK
jgi:peptide/nickel transport system substrate-binding protein